MELEKIANIGAPSKINIIVKRDKIQTVNAHKDSNVNILFLLETLPFFISIKSLFLFSNIVAQN